MQSVDLQSAWEFLKRLARLEAERARCGYRLGEDGALERLTPGHPQALAEWEPGAGWRVGPTGDGEASSLLDLYLPTCDRDGAGRACVAHLGQSIDGYIATRTGDSCFVTGPSNIVHLHRMRALSDAVLVGASTVASDDPRLTTRRVSGDNPLRVVLDPSGRLPSQHRVFQDREAATLIVRAAGVRAWTPTASDVEVAPIATHGGRLDLRAVLECLAKRGATRVFVEGGGVTVSAFLAAGLLHRLQITVSPLIIGEGRRAIDVPGRDALSDCLRPAQRVISMGDDVLFDLDLRSAARA